MALSIETRLVYHLFYKNRIYELYRHIYTVQHKTKHTVAPVK